jgi:hypothetical protein
MRPVLLLALLLAGCARQYVVTELAPGEERRARAPESVEVFKNAPPSRTFVARYVLDANKASPQPEAESIATYREIAATLGCDAVVVYGLDHPAVGLFRPGGGSDALVLEMDGTLHWKDIGGNNPDHPRMFWVATARGVMGMAPNGTSAGLCLVY